MEEILDCAIIGGGPAGLTAGLYATRGGLDNVVLFEMTSTPGGQITKSSEIENYPGFFDRTKTGMDFMSTWQEQCFSFGLKREEKKVDRVQKEGKTFNVLLSNGNTVKARTVIVCTGSKARKAGFEGEEKFWDKGISDCATCDGYLYKDKPVTVVGGGDTGLEEALFLSKICSDVYVVHKDEEFTAAPPTVARVLKKKNIHLIKNSVVEEAFGNAEHLEGVKIKNTKTGETSALHTPACFVFVGYDINNSVLKDDEGKFICDVNYWGQVIPKFDMETSVAGLFVAGDIRLGAPKQVISAAGDGSVAALSMIAHLKREDRQNQEFLEG